MSSSAPRSIRRDRDSTESELILSLVASGLMRLPWWRGPEDSRNPYPTALQQGLDRLTWMCWSRSCDPPAGVADLVTEWCAKPLAMWPLVLPAGAVSAGDRLLIDGEPSETCRDWAVANPDVVGEVLESQFMHEVRSTCRSMGQRGQQLYVALRRLAVDKPVLSALELLKQRNRFPNLPAWSQWLGEAYVAVNADDAMDELVGVCTRCRQLTRPGGDGWRCSTPRCLAKARPARVSTLPAKGTLKLRRDLVTYISLPGRPEADLAEVLEKAGATVVWWPDVDAYDLLVIWPDGTRWGIDVKDWRTPYALARRLRPLPVYPSGHEYAYDKGFVIIPKDRTSRRRNYLAVLRRHSVALREQRQVEALTTEDLLARIPGGRRGA